MNPIGKLKISKPDEPEPNVGRTPPDMAGIARPTDATASSRNTRRIEVQSEVGKGTTFRVWLPVKQQSG